MRARAPRTLEVAPALIELLDRARRAAGVEDTAQVDLDELHGIEVATSFRFPDDILAALAADVPRLRQRCGFTLREIVGHCGRLRDRRARGDLIGVAETGAGIWAIDKRRAGAATVLFPVDGAAVGEPKSLLEWLSDAVGPVAEAAGGDPAFAPVLHRKPAMADTPGRKIKHPKFGLGVAFAEVGLGPTRKVTCDFPGLGLKIIQARFLEFLD